VTSFSVISGLLPTNQVSSEVTRHAYQPIKSPSEETESPETESPPIVAQPLAWCGSVASSPGDVGDEVTYQHLKSLKGIEPNTFSQLQGFVNRLQIRDEVTS
jgi:hypothetical protein